MFPALSKPTTPIQILIELSWGEARLAAEEAEAAAHSDQCASVAAYAQSLWWCCDALHRLP